MIRSVSLGASKVPIAAEDGVRMLWMMDPSPAARSALARRVRARLEARGRPVLILDETTLARRPERRTTRTEAAETLRRAREVGRLVERLGVYVVFDLESSAEDAYPGRSVASSGDEERWLGDWTI